MRRGEIRWYKFPQPDKQRPVLILSRTSVIDYLNEVTIAPITTTIRDIPSEVRLTKADGVAKECVINFDHIQTISKAKLGPVIATLAPVRLQEVRRAVLFALEL